MAYKEDCPECVKWADHPEPLLRDTCDYSHAQKIARDELPDAIVSTVYYPHHGEAFGFGTGMHETMVFAKQEKPKLLVQKFSTYEDRARRIHRNLVATFGPKEHS